MNEVRIACTQEYSVQELQEMLLKPPYQPVNMYEGQPVHTILAVDNLKGEVFRKGVICGTDMDGEYFESLEVSGSNLGRVKNYQSEEILIQRIDPEKKTKDYLYVEVSNKKGKTHKVYVYKIIAGLWCKKPEVEEGKILHIHHITNNAFDNRPSNLIWVEGNMHLTKIH